MTSVLQVLTSPAAAAMHVLPLLADAAIKGIVIFGLAALAVTLCRRRSAATRHAIWAGAVVAQLALPTLSAFLPAWRVPLVERLDRRFAPADFATMAPPSGDVVIAASAPNDVDVPDDADVSVEAAPVTDVDADND